MKGEVTITVPQDSRGDGSRFARVWVPEVLTWQQLVGYCSQTVRTAESYAEFRAWGRSSDADTKNRATAVKDVGGFVGGRFSGQSRRKGELVERSLITLDIDKTDGLEVTANEIWRRLVSRYNVAAVCYSTHSHCPEAPRLRIVIPTERTMTAEEYPAVARAVAEAIGMEMMDTTAFSPEHLMFWPSTALDGEFFFRENAGEWLRPDEVMPKKKPKQPKQAPAEAVAPTSNDKPTVAEAFCRVFTVEEAIDTYLYEVYVAKTAPTNAEETARYTYAAGTTANGVVCYGHRWAVSNHDTDPARGRKRSAYELVRIHRFGHLDGEAGNARRSSRAMVEWAMTIDRVKAAMLGISDGEAWKIELEYDKEGKVKSSSRNILLVMNNDPSLAGRVWYDCFDEVIHCAGLPWHSGARDNDEWRDSDDAELRIYMENEYGISNSRRIDDCMVKCANANVRHAVRDYLNALPAWDGTERLDRLFIDYIGAEDTPLTRAMTRKWCVAAVARVIHPGCKFDYCLVTAGRQGIGKSSVFEILGGAWHNGSINTMEGKDGREALRGNWIVELAELVGVKRSRIEVVKAFITDRGDKYRPPYGRRVVAHPRQCVFCATTNEEQFLKDDTGNRRWWVVAVDDTLRRHDIVDYKAALSADRDQLWAEALARYREGETLYLDPDLEQELAARQAQFEDNANEELAEQITCYLSRPLPMEWNRMSLLERRRYYGEPMSTHDLPTQVRTTFTAKEFMAEFLGHSHDRTDRYLARRINAIMRTLPDWQYTSTPCIYTTYMGQQRGYRRIISPDTELVDIEQPLL